MSSSKPQITAEKAWGHLRTINAHKCVVLKECFQIGLYRQGLMHDLSKYSPVEFLAGCRYYQGGRRSPNNGEREEQGYSAAWLHHKGRNRHHFEYWLDYSLKKEGAPLEPAQMPRKYVAEMLMDRIAASKIYNGESYTRHDPLAYCERGKHRYLIHPQTAKELHGMLRILDRRGEKVLYRFVKEEYLKGRPI